MQQRSCFSRDNTAMDGLLEYKATELNENNCISNYLHKQINQQPVITHLFCVWHCARWSGSWRKRPPKHILISQEVFTTIHKEIYKINAYNQYADIT